MPVPHRTVLHISEVTGGGVEHAIRQYVETVREVDHVIVAPHGSDLAGVTTAHFIPFSGKGMARRKDIEHATKTVKPTLIHAHSSWAGLRARTLRLDVPIAYQPHAFAFSGHGSSSLVRRSYRAMETLLARRAASFLTLSDHETTLARSLSSSVPIAQVINTSGVSIAQHQTWLASSSPKVVMAGRIAPQKDPEFYIRFGESLRGLVPGVALSWIGDGDPKMRQGLITAGIEVTGWLPQDQVAEHLARASVYVHTARYEGFPLSVLDAAAVGMPIVLRRTPSTSGNDLLQGDSPQDVAQLAADILNGNRLDQALKLSHKLSAKHSASAQRSSLLSAYETTVQTSSESTR